MKKDRKHPFRDIYPPRLSAAEERRLAERVKAGDKRAIEQLVLANRRLVGRIARTYKAAGTCKDDLIQEGSVGLIRAAQHFDPSTGASRFSCYAGFWIRAFMQRAVASDSSLVRVPKHTRRLRKRSVRTLRDCEQHGGVDSSSGGRESPARNQVARSMGRSLHPVATTPQGGDERQTCALLEEAPTQSQTAEYDLLAQEERAAVHAALRRLSPFEAWVIRERFGLGEWCSEPIDATSLQKSGDSPSTAAQDQLERPSKAARPRRGWATYYSRTHKKLSQDCGLSVHRLRQAEKTALEKLRSILT